MRFVVLTAATLLVAAPANAATIQVPAEYATIQAALGAATAGDTVLVACGTYFEFDTEVPSGVVLRSETGLPECVHVSDAFGNRVLTFTGSSPSTRVEGITLYGAYSPGPGGAVHIRAGAAPTFYRCVLALNRSDQRGGAVWVNNASPRFEQCTFFGNRSEFNAAHIYAQAGAVVSLDRCILAEGLGAESVWCFDSSITASCCVLFNNEDGDYVDCLAGQEGQAGNIVADPLLCDPYGLDLSITPSSPCAPANSGGCGLVGAVGVACGTISVETTSWSRLKSHYR